MFTNRLVNSRCLNNLVGKRLINTTTQSSLIKSTNYSYNNYYSSSNNNHQQTNNNNNDNNKYKSKIIIGGIGLITFGLFSTSGTILLDDNEKKEKGPTYREKVITNYQNRIREFSSPEKIFDTFASVSKGGEAYMTLDDFVRAITPHQFRGASSQGTKSSPAVRKDAPLPLSFRMADVDGDGLISFSEFMFFSTLLSIPEHSARIAFKIIDINHDNSLDINEFSRMVNLLRSQSKLTSNSTTQKPLVAQGWSEHLFGKNGEKKLSVEQFQALIDQLHRDILQLEFNMYDTQGAGVISQRDFGTLIASYANNNKVESYIQATKSLPSTIDSNNKGISFDQFVSFNKLLTKLDDVELTIDLYKGINQSFTKKKFKYVSKIIANFDATPEIVDTIYTIFDTDKNGDLEKDEFVNLLRRKKYRGLNSQRSTGFLEKLEKIYQVIIGDL